jgi:hypothetical protein
MKLNAGIAVFFTAGIPLREDRRHYSDMAAAD